MHLRVILKKKLVGKVSQPFWIGDSCMASAAGTDRTVTDRIAGLRGVCAADGVHFTNEGYCNIADYLVKTVKEVADGRFEKKDCSGRYAPACSVSGSSRSHFWRGISSPVGSNKPPLGAYQNKQHRDKPHRAMTPYARGGGGGWRGSGKKW